MFVSTDFLISISFLFCCVFASQMGIQNNNNSKKMAIGGGNNEKFTTPPTTPMCHPFIHSSLWKQSRDRQFGVLFILNIIWRSENSVVFLAFLNNYFMLFFFYFFIVFFCANFLFFQNNFSNYIFL